MEQDEKKLVQRLRKGEATAFHLVLDAHYTDIFQKLLYLTGGDRERAADLTQETFVAAWRSLWSFRGHSSLRTWLHTVAVRTWHRAWQRGREQEPLVQLLELQDPGSLPETLTIEQLERERLHCAIFKLPPLYRSVVVLAYLDQLSHPQIAALLKIPLGTVKSRLSTALVHLRRSLSDPREES